MKKNKKRIKIKQIRKQEGKETKNSELQSYCYWSLNLTTKTHISILYLGIWKLCIILMPH